MSREIKIRAWDPLRNKMVTGEEIEETLNSDGSNTYYAGLSYGSVFVGAFDEKGDWCECDVMQFTGLHDKNGKEIFEGDIVSLDTLCPFHAGGTIWKVIPHIVRYEERRQSFCPDRLKESEVIGNTHENPELLNI